MGHIKEIPNKIKIRNNNNIEYNLKEDKAFILTE